MSRALTAPVMAALLLLAACGGGDQDEVADSSAPTTSSSSAATTPSARETQRSTTPPATTAQVFTPEEEAAFVATVTAGTFAENGDALSQQLVKSNSLIEAQTDFRFDQPSRTVVLAVTSVFETGSPDVAYGLATDFAPLFWGPEATSAVRAESLPLFSVTVDDSSYLCDPVAMVALADRELSTDMFVGQCGTTS